MRRVFLFGGTCSVLAFLIIMSGSVLNFNLQNVLLGLALGAATGLIRTHSPLTRISAFSSVSPRHGVLCAAGWLSFLPPGFGNAIAVVIVLMLMTTISALTCDRLPLWAMFIGNAAFAGAYNGYFNTTPWLFETQAIQVAAAMLFSAGAGFLVRLLVEFRRMRGGVNLVDPMEPTGPSTIPGDADVLTPVLAGAPSSAGPLGSDSASNDSPSGKES